MNIEIIVAMTQDRVIGKANKLPWHYPEDLKRFKRLTLGHPVVMGRKTFESIGRPLPGRRNIVLSGGGFSGPGIEVFGSLEEALGQLEKEGADRVFILGGRQVFEKALPMARTFHVTWVRGNFDGDAFFPPFDFSALPSATVEAQTPDLRFVTYMRPKF